MFIAHIPAGYITSRQIANRLAHPDRGRRIIMIGLLASIFPDLDLLYFYSWGQRMVPHHQYWTHIPMFWLMMAGGYLLFYGYLRRVFPVVYAATFFCAIFLHLILDSIAAEIYWTYPFSEKPWQFIQIKPVYHWWVWNFILHWTFLFELAICLWAVFVWRSQLKMDKIS